MSDICVKFPADLIRAFNEGKVVALIGSGPSVAAGYPTWPQLIDRMVTECERQIPGFADGAELRQLVQTGYLVEAAEACHQSLRGQHYRGLIEDIFLHHQHRPVPLHGLLTQLPFAAVLTTNYDTLLEQAYVERPRSDGFPIVYNQRSCGQLPKLADERRFFIFKLHGDATEPDSLVLTKRHYADLLHNNRAYLSALSALLTTRTVLFIGFGLRDPDMNLVLEEQAALFKSYGRQHYALLPDPGTIMPRLFRDNYNVTVLPYSSKDGHAELEILLQRLLAQLTPAPTASERVEAELLHQLMGLEQRFCTKLGTFVELERARFLKVHADKGGFTDTQRQLLDESVHHWESTEDLRRSLESQLQHAQRMESIGQLAAGVAHDFNNILTVILGHSALLKAAGDLSQAQRSEGLQAIEDAASRAAQLTRQLLMFGRRALQHPAVLDPNEVVKNIAKMLRRLIGEQIDFQIVPDPATPRILADASSVEQIVMNLVVNARDAMPQGGRIVAQTAGIEIGPGETARHPQARPGRYATLTIADTGCGMSPETLARIFEPFFTTKAPGKGTGLGLSTVYGLVRQHGGWIEVASALEQGTTFTLYFPAAAAATEVTVGVGATPQASPSRTILLVEDEELVRELVSNILRCDGYEIIAAHNGEEALEFWKGAASPIDLLLTDIVMPGLSGPELAARLLTLKPDLKIICMSGYRPEEAVMAQLQTSEAMTYLPKPFTVEQLRQTVQAALAGKLQPSQPPLPAEVGTPSARASHTILLVDDDPSILSLYASALKNEGYAVVEARNGDDALERWQEHRKEMPLAVIDLVMPGTVPGIGVARRLAADHTVRLILTSGYSLQDLELTEADLMQLGLFLHKPFTPAQLLEAIHTTLAAQPHC